MKIKQQPVLRLCPRCLLHIRIEVIMPPATTLHSAVLIYYVTTKTYLAPTLPPLLLKCQHEGVAAGNAITAPGKWIEISRKCKRHNKAGSNKSDLRLKKVHSYSVTIAAYATPAARSSQTASVQPRPQPKPTRNLVFSHTTI